MTMKPAAALLLLSAAGVAHAGSVVPRKAAVDVLVRSKAGAIEEVTDFERKVQAPENVLQDFSHEDTRRALDPAATAWHHSTLQVRNSGAYAGWVEIGCEHGFRRQTDDSRPYGTLHCNSVYTIGWTLSAPTQMRVELDVVAWGITGLAPWSHVRASVDSKVGKLFFAGGKYGATGSSLQGTVQAGSASVNLRVQRGTSGGLKDQKSKGVYRLRWELSSNRYHADGGAGSEEIKGAALVDDGAGGKVYQSDKMELLTTQALPVDVAQRYRLSGRMRSVGEEVGQVYFGLHCLDKNGDVIESVTVNRRGTDGVVAGVQADGATLELAGAVEGWAAPETAWHQRALGIYYDGDVTKRPDHVVHDRVLGGYSAATGSAVLLSAPLPQEVQSRIVAGVTVVKNHRQSSGHIYFGSGDVPREWTAYSGELQGVSWENSFGSFRPETRSVRIYVAANWLQGSGLQFDDLVLERV